MAGRTMRLLGITALVIGYPLLAHYTNISAHGQHLGALLSVAPLLVIALADGLELTQALHHAVRTRVVMYCANDRMVCA